MNKLSYYLITIIFVSSGVTLADSTYDFGSSNLASNNISHELLQIEDDVRRTQKVLVKEMVEWKKLLQTRRLASVDLVEQENFEFWLELEEKVSEDPTYWLKEINKIAQ